MKNFFRKFQNYFYSVFMLLALGTGVFLGYQYIEKKYLSEEVQVVFLQVHRGDSTYIKTPHGKEIVIDGGQDLSTLSALERHRPFYDRHLDLLIITHPDSDHYYGFVEVLKRFSVDNILEFTMVKITWLLLLITSIMFFCLF